MTNSIDNRGQTTMNHTRTLKICGAVLISALAGTTAYGEIVDTRIGKLELERGLPTKESVAKLFEAQEFQRATQAYIWGLPLVGAINLGY
jgi:hypothetical protein